MNITVKKTIQPQLLDLEFAIQEGPKTGVAEITALGNTVFSAKEIKQQMALRESGWFIARPFREDLLDRDLDNLRERYLDAGYLSASVKKNVVMSRDGRSAVVVIDINEGAQTRTGGISFEGNTAFTATMLQDKVILNRARRLMNGPLTRTGTVSFRRTPARVTSMRGWTWKKSPATRGWTSAM